MTTFAWGIPTLYTIQQPDPDYVVQAVWTLTATDGSYTSSLQGKAIFSSDQSTPFIPYDELTEQIVIGWVRAYEGADNIARYEVTLQEKIDAQITPPPVPEETPLPWAAPAA